MRTLKHMRSDKQKRIAKETLEIFGTFGTSSGIFNEMGVGRFILPAI